jgi:hypothetical protein
MQGSLLQTGMKSPIVSKVLAAVDYLKNFCVHGVILGLEAANVLHACIGVKRDLAF